MKTSWVVFVLVFLVSSAKPFYAQPRGPYGPPADNLQTSSESIHSVNTFVENLRSLLSPGRKVVRFEPGSIQAALLEGTTGSYELYWLGTTNNGMTWNQSPHLGQALPGDDRGQMMSLNNDGTFLGYNESTPGNGILLFNPDPIALPDGFSVLTDLGPGKTLTGLYADQQSSSIVYGYVDSSGAGIVVLPGAAVPQAISMVSTESPGAIVAGPIVAMAGNYVFASLLLQDEPGITPTDTAITNHALPGGWPAFMESTDGGATWSLLAPVFGLNLGDFPTTTGSNDGTTGPVSASGGNDLASFNDPVVADGRLWLPSMNRAVTLNDGTFPYGFWDFIQISGASWKPAAGGGAWSHFAVSRLEASGGGLIAGDTWYPKISALRGGTPIVGLTYNDRATAPDRIHLQATADLGTTWSDHIYDAADSLGIPNPTASIFFDTSPWMFDENGIAALDMVYLADDGGVVNNTVYHIVMRTSTVVRAEESKGSVPGQINLQQNYPNPFNPSTTVGFSLEKPADVNLSVFNVLGQKVAVIASGRYDAGEHHFLFNRDGLSSGVYFYTLKTGNFTTTKKMLLVK